VKLVAFVAMETQILCNILERKREGEKEGRYSNVGKNKRFKNLFNPMIRPVN
jgi:hypothetical protein